MIAIYDGQIEPADKIDIIMKQLHLNIKFCLNIFIAFFLQSNHATFVRTLALTVDYLNNSFFYKSIGDQLNLIALAVLNNESDIRHTLSHYYALICM